jgi:DNA-binding Xre family transcriptional regulator
MKTREELVQVVYDAWAAKVAADRDLADATAATATALTALVAYDKENTSQLDRLEKLLCDVTTGEFDDDKEKI